MEKFYIIWSPDSSQNPVKTHTNKDEAITELKRLAAKETTKQFYLMESVVACKATVETPLIFI